MLVEQRVGIPLFIAETTITISRERLKDDFFATLLEDMSMARI